MLDSRHPEPRGFGKAKDSSWSSKDDVRASLDDVVTLVDLGIEDLARLDARNASLGEMIDALRPISVLVPGGFASTADAYHACVAYNNIEGEIRRSLGVHHASDLTVHEAGSRIRLIIEGDALPAVLGTAI